MPLPPTQYRPTDYPLRYRPFGQRSTRESAPEAPGEVAVAPRRRWRWALLAAMLLLTMAVHAGIAWGSSGSDSTRAGKGGSDTTEAGGSCDTTVEEITGDEGLEGGTQSGGTTAQSDPTRAPL